MVDKPIILMDVKCPWCGNVVMLRPISCFLEFESLTCGNCGQKYRRFKPGDTARE